MKSGMRHIIYIIEDFAGYDVGPSLEAIQTSISSSQTVNNFFVKRTKNIQETVSYLLRISKLMSKMHQVSHLLSKLIQRTAISPSFHPPKSMHGHSTISKPVWPRPMSITVYDTKISLRLLQSQRHWMWAIYSWRCWWAFGVSVLKRQSKFRNIFRLWYRWSRHCLRSMRQREGCSLRIVVLNTVGRRSGTS